MTYHSFVFCSFYVGDGNLLYTSNHYLNRCRFIFLSYITLMSHERHVISNNRQRNGLLNRLFMLTSNNIEALHCRTFVMRNHQWSYQYRWLVDSIIVLFPGFVKKEERTNRPFTWHQSSDHSHMIWNDILNINLRMQKMCLHTDRVLITLVDSVGMPIP